MRNKFGGSAASSPASQRDQADQKRHGALRVRGFSRTANSGGDVLFPEGVRLEDGENVVPSDRGAGVGGFASVERTYERALVAPDSAHAIIPLVAVISVAALQGELQTLSVVDEVFPAPRCSSV